MIKLVAVSVTIAAIGLLSSNHIQGSEPRSFVYVEKGDTGGGETFTRTADMIRGDMVMGKKRVHYEGRIAPDGMIPRFEIRASHVGDAKPVSEMTVTIGRDSGRVIEHRGAKTDTVRFASQPGMVPLINPSMGLIELLVARARSQKSKTVTVPTLLIDGLNLDSKPATPLDKRAGPFPVGVTFLSADTVRLSNGTSKDQVRIALDQHGRIRGAKSGTTAHDHFEMIPTTKAVTNR